MYQYKIKDKKVKIHPLVDVSCAKSSELVNKSFLNINIQKRISQ